MNREQRRKNKYGAGVWFEPRYATLGVEYFGEFDGFYSVCKLIKTGNTSTSNYKDDISNDTNSIVYDGSYNYNEWKNDKNPQMSITPKRICVICPEKGKEHVIS